MRVIKKRRCCYSPQREGELKVMWEATRGCPLKCRYCDFLSKDQNGFEEEKVLKAGLITRTVQRLKKLGATKVTLAGGSLDWYPQLLTAAVEALSYYNLPFSVFLNGYHIEQVKEVLLEKRPTHISVSMDSLDYEFNDKNRFEGAWMKANRVVDAYMGLIPVHVEATISGPRGWEKAAEICFLEGLTAVSLTPVHSEFEEQMSRVHRLFDEIQSFHAAPTVEEITVSGFSDGPCPKGQMLWVDSEGFISRDCPMFSLFDCNTRVAAPRRTPSGPTKVYNG